MTAPQNNKEDCHFIFIVSFYFSIFPRNPMIFYHLIISIAAEIQIHYIKFKYRFESSKMNMINASIW